MLCALARPVRRHSASARVFTKNRIFAKGCLPDVMCAPVLEMQKGDELHNLEHVLGGTRPERISKQSAERCKLPHYYKTQRTAPFA